LPVSPLFIPKLLLTTVLSARIVPNKNPVRAAQGQSKRRRAGRFSLLIYHSTRVVPNLICATWLMPMTVLLLQSGFVFY